MLLTPEHLIGSKVFEKNQLHHKTYKNLQEHGLSGHRYFKLFHENHDNKNNKIVNIFLKSQFENLQKFFLKNGIERCIPLKGLSLLENVYKNIGDRRLTDIDILIRPSEFEKVRHVLVREGYKEFKEKKWLATKHKSVFVKKNFLVDIEVEVHTQLFYHFSCENYESELKQKKMSLEMEFLYLCFHLAEQHNFLKLKWLYDLYLFFELKKACLDFDKVNRIACEAKIEPSLNATLYCLEKYFQCSIPKKINVELPSIIKETLSWEFLRSPNRRSLPYLKLKSYLKRNRKSQYYMHWLFNKLK